MPVYKVFLICSRNSDDVYIGYTNKQYVYSLYTYYTTLYNRFVALGDDYKQKYLWKRKYFTVLSQGSNYYRIVKQIDCEKADIKYHIRELKFSEKPLSEL